MQTISEVLCSSQEVLRQDQPKQAPTRPQIAQIRDLRGITAMGTLALYSLYARQPFIFPSMKTLAKDMKVSLSTARRAVSELKRMGYLQVTPRIRQTNLFSLTLPGATPPLASMPPPPCQADTPPLSPMTPPPVTHDTPPLSPMTPQVAIRSIQDKKQKKERERARTLSAGNHSLKETLTCPECEHTWPKDYGPVCHTCRMDIGTIQRRIDEGKRVGKKREVSFEERVAEIKAISREMEARKQAKKQSKAKPPVKKPQAEEPKKSLEEAEAERQSTRQFLFDETGKTYDEAILEHLAKEAGTV